MSSPAGGRQQQETGEMFGYAPEYMGRELQRFEGTATSKLATAIINSLLTIIYVFYCLLLFNMPQHFTDLFIYLFALIPTPCCIVHSRLRVAYIII